MTVMNKALFEEMTNGSQPVLVEFWAPWCVYCRRIAPALEKVAAERTNQLPVAQINIDEEPLVAEQEQIEVIPTLVIYRDGKVLDSIVAPESKARIDEFIRRNLEEENHG